MSPTMRLRMFAALAVLLLASACQATQTALLRSFNAGGRAEELQRRLDELDGELLQHGRVGDYSFAAVRSHLVEESKAALEEASESKWEERVGAASLQALVQAEAEREQAAAESDDDDTFFSSYHSLADIEAFLQSLAARAPSVATVVQLGTSSEGRAVRGIRLHAGDGNAPRVLLNGGIHAREWITPAAMCFVANALLSSFLQASNETVPLLQQLEWTIIPVLNVDGYVYSRSSSSNRLWRKTRQLNGNSACIGTDANRNFDYRWSLNLGSSSDPCSQRYKGAAAFSSPTAQVVRDFVQERAGATVMYIDYHNYAQIVIPPYTLSLTGNAVPTNDPRTDDVGQQLTAGMLVEGTTYGYGDTLGAISGATSDWTYHAANVPFSYTVELRPTSSNPGFLLPATQIRGVGQEVTSGLVRGATRMLRYVQNMTISNSSSSSSSNGNGSGSSGSGDATASSASPSARAAMLATVLLFVLAVVMLAV